MFKEPLTHHFYIIEGDTDENHTQLQSYLVEDQNLTLTSNPDVYMVDYQSLGIDEARLLKDFFTTRTFGEGIRIAIVKTSAITREAQNAMLKLTEEPAANSRIFFLIPHIGLLIHTLRSRGYYIASAKTNSDKLGKEFIKKSIPDRLVYVQKITTKKDRAQAVELIDSLVAWGRVEGNAASMKEIYMARSYIEDTSSSIKLLLEHLSLILPISK